MGAILSGNGGVLKEDVNLEECHKGKRTVIPFCGCIQVWQLLQCRRSCAFEVVILSDTMCQVQCFLGVP